MAKKNIPVESKKGELNKNDLVKILKGARIAVAGTLLAYGADIIPGINFGTYTPVISAALMIIINAGLKWYAGQPKPK